MSIDLSLAYNSLPYLFKGAWITIQIATISYFVGFVLGTVLGFLQTRNNTLLKAIITIYVALIRGTPMLIQITFFYYVLPAIGINLSPFWAATYAISINSSAYISQIIKSGILAVGKEQIEAAKVLGFNSFQVARYIVIPQAIRIVFPALIGECVTLIKDSSLASVIGVMELYKESRAIMNQTYDVVTIFCLVALFYLVLTTLAELLLKFIEKKMGWYVKN